MPGDFDTVKERVDIVQVIGESVPLRKAGRIYKALCPFHSEKTPSFTVDPDRRTYKCFGCLPPGSLIKTAHGPRPIEGIRIGDLVYAGDGRLHPVLLTHEHMFAGELVKLTCAPFKIPLLLTPNHKVPVLRPKSKRLEQVEAGSIRPQNYLLYPRMERPCRPLDWSANLSWFGSRGREPKSLPSQVGVPLFAEWLGWYLAEGSVSNDRSVRFSLGGHESDVANRLCELSAALFDERPRVAHLGSKIEMWFCHALLSRWLKHHCGDGAKNKRLPDFVWNWKPEEQRSLFNALVLGDGTVNPSGYVHFYGYTAEPSWSLASASPALIDDVRDLLLMNGVVPSLKQYTQRDGRMSWHLTVTADARDQWQNEHQSVGPFAVRVRNVEMVPYEGHVYNLTVDQEHTYLTMSGAVCNCGEGGDVFTWLEKREGLTPAEALERLAERAGVEIRRRSPEEREAHARLLAAHEVAYFYFRQALRGTAGGAAATSYLERRGIRPQTIEKFGLGYAPELKQGLLGYVRKKGYSDDEAVQSGLVVRTERGELLDRFRDRLMVPIRDARGRVIAFAGRALGAEQTPKYTNSPATPLFDKGRTLFALDLARPAIRKAREAVVVEGQFDAISAHQAGIENVVASMGTALTPAQYELLRPIAEERAVIAFDADPAGLKAAESRGRDLLALAARMVFRGRSLATSAALDLRVALMPEGYDPDELVRKDPDRFRAAVAGAKPVMEFLLDLVEGPSDLATQAGRRAYLQQALALLAELADPVERDTYVRRVAERAGVAEEVLRQQLGRVAARGAAGGVPVEAAGKERAGPERYLVAQLLRFPEQAHHVELSAEDIADPGLRAVFELLRKGERPERFPADLRAIGVDLAAEVPEPSSAAELVTALGQAALRVREQSLRRRLEETRAALARGSGDPALGGEVERLASELERVMAAREQHTVLERVSAEEE